MGPTGPQGPEGPRGPAGAPGADGRPLPKTGDTANMALWLMMFALGLLGFTTTSTMLAIAKRQKEKTSMIIIRDEKDQEHFFIR